MSDEPVVSEDGELCTIKDCCVVICDSDGTVTNPPRFRPFADRSRLNAAYEAVRASTEKLHGWGPADSVSRVLMSLPVHYNPRLTRAIGRAKFRYVNGQPMATEIELTSAYAIPESYLHTLFVHEGCHVARAVIDPMQFRMENPHGYQWGALMRGAGEEAKAQCGIPEIEAQVRKRKGHPEVSLTISDFNVGDRVFFQAGKRGRIVGTIIYKTDKGAMLQDDSAGKWRVGYGLLTKETPT